MRSEGISIHQAPEMVAGVSVCPPPSVITRECGGQPRGGQQQEVDPVSLCLREGPRPCGKCLCVAGSPTSLPTKHRWPERGQSRGGDGTATRGTRTRAADTGGRRWQRPVCPAAPGICPSASSRCPTPQGLSTCIRGALRGPSAQIRFCR